MADWNDYAFIEYYDKYAEEVHCDIGTDVKHPAERSRNSDSFREVREILGHSSK